MMKQLKVYEPIKKIDVYEHNPILGFVLYKSFETITAFEMWMENEKSPRFDVDADQVAINGQILLGWDEYEDMVINHREDHLHQTAYDLMMTINKNHGWEVYNESLDEYVLRDGLTKQEKEMCWSILEMFDNL